MTIPPTTKRFPPLPLPPLRGLFFDLDDTLIRYADAERTALEAGCALAARVNPAVDPDSLADAIYEVYTRRYRYGTPGYADLATLPVDAFRRELTADALHTFGIDDPELTDALVRAYARAEEQALEAFPDTDETLQRLRPHFRMGLITNGPSAMQRAKLAALALEGYFDAIVVDTEFGHPKPDARIFEHAADAIGLGSHELIFVGNSLAHDIEARAPPAGPASGSTRPGEPLRPGDPVPDHTISCLAELINLPPRSRRPRACTGTLQE
jgi:putative hydrolase of the HAD superfamily